MKKEHIKNMTAKASAMTIYLVLGIVFTVWTFTRSGWWIIGSGLMFNGLIVDSMQFMCILVGMIEAIVRNHDEEVHDKHGTGTDFVAE